MTGPVIRWASLIPGLLCLLVGLLWAMQGAGIIGGGLMAGQTLWLVIGALLAIVGLVLIYRGLAGRWQRG